MRSKFLYTLMVSTLIGFLGIAHADDTDIYLNANLPPDSEPLVMFSIDWRPNLTSTVCQSGECQELIDGGWLVPADPSKIQFFEMLRAVLKRVFEPLTGVKIGLMLSHDNSGGNAGPPGAIPGNANGGFIAQGFQLFDSLDTNGAKANFHALLEAIPTPQGAAAHAYQGRELFHEFYRYLTGLSIYNGHNGFTSFDGSTGIAAFNLDVEHAGLSWDTGIEAGGLYNSPLVGVSQCTKVFTVNFMFQVSNQDADSDATIELATTMGGMGLNPAEGDFTDVLAMLQNTDLADGTIGSGDPAIGTAPDIGGTQNVTSYFVVDPTKVNSTTNGYAIAGGTDGALGLADDPAALQATLENILSEILSVSTTFVSASIPVNVFNRAEVIDNAFLALFKTDPEGRPAWAGNLKKLKLDGLGTSTVTVVDATGAAAIDADGRINNTALTHWTSAADLPPPDFTLDEVAGKDGRSPSRGAAGQKIPGFISGGPGNMNGAGNRMMYYDATPTTLAALNVDNATGSALQSDLGAASVNKAKVLIEFARGLEKGKTWARDWIMNDPLHSKPLPINYGTLGGYSDTNPAIYIAMGTGGGMLHLVRNTTTGGAESGAEVWSFMPREVMGNLSALVENKKGVAHPYGVDGAPVAYIEDVDEDGNIEAGDGDKVYLYFGLRRGGRAYYAMDVTDPENPSLMWRIDNATANFSELGYTFSQPRTGLVASPGGPVPAVIFAGGYDLNKDDRSGIGTADSYGDAIYVVNAETGALIWKAIGGGGAATSTVFQHADLVDSIPSTVSAVDTDGDELLDRVVVGDSGGNVWRADLQGSDSSNWKLTRLAAVGRHAVGSAGVLDDRRFFHRPDLVQTKDGIGSFDAVLIGSGDRPDPLDQGGTVSNYFYMIKDRNTGAGTGTDVVIDHADFGDVTDNCLQTNPACGTDLTDGWKLEMEDTSEKVLATPLTVGGVVFFTSYLPQVAALGSSCEPSEGAGRLYAVALQDATGVFNFDKENDDPDAPAGDEDRNKDLLSPGIPPEVLFLPEDIIMTPDFETLELDLKTRARTFWHAGEDSDL